MRLIILSIFLGILSLPAISQDKAAKFTDSMKTGMREKVKEAAGHAWKGYLKYAKGADDLRPLSLKPKNWYSHPILMTPIDAFDTFLLIGMEEEASQAKELILTLESFEMNNEVQVFEVTIRILGGLISAYEMDGNKKFIDLATDLADRMLPAFNSPTGMPYRYINLKTGKVRDSINNPAEVGTLLLEFGQLSKHTGDTKYYKTAKRAILEIYNRRSKLDLPGEQIDVVSGKWVNTRSHISGYIDSYFEYLYKGGLLFNDDELIQAFRVHEKAISEYMAVETENGTFFQQVDMHTGKPLSTRYGALDAFYAGLLAYSGNTELAATNQKANYYMWTKFNMEPESFDFITDSVKSPYYILRPENIESAFYLFRTTKMNEYLWMAKVMTEDILRNCRTKEAYASIKNVKTMEKMDSMESFFFAETLKYAWLIFADENHPDLKKVVFNTEAHPFKISVSK